MFLREPRLLMLSFLHVSLISATLATQSQNPQSTQENVITTKEPLDSTDHIEIKRSSGVGLTFFFLVTLQCQQRLPYPYGREMAFKISEDLAPTESQDNVIISKLVEITNLKGSGTTVYPVIDEIS